MIISKYEQFKMICWIYLNLYKFNTNQVAVLQKQGGNRKFLKISKKCPKIFQTVKKRIIEKEKFSNLSEDSLYGDQILFTSYNGYVNRHIDETLDGFKHIRANLFLSVPTKGGTPIYNNRYITPEERNYILCDTSLPHMSDQVKSLKPRIVISYEFLVNEKN